MSLIETAIRNAKARGERPAPVQTHLPAQPQAPAQSATPRVEPAIVGNWQFAVAQCDPDAMERFGVLNQVQDDDALRAYKILRTRVQQRMAANHWRSLAVTAASAGEGKTLTSINLAIALARDAETSVILVDLDMQRPKLGSYFGLSFGRDLSDYLVGAAGLEDIIYTPVGIERLAVIPNAKPVPQASELINSARMNMLVQSLASDRRHGIVIYDLPPVLMSDDVLRFLPNVDSLLLVVAEGGPNRSALQRISEVVAEDRMLGVVLNRSVDRQAGGYY